MLDPKIEGELKKAFKQNVLVYIAMVLSMNTVSTWMTTAGRPFSPPVQQFMTLSVVIYAICDSVVIISYSLIIIINKSFKGGTL